MSEQLSQQTHVQSTATALARDSSSESHTQTRKLPRSLRKANFVFKLGMAALSAANLILLALNSSESVTIPTIYFEIMAVLASAAPPVWSNFLDKCKEYIAELTPPDSPTAPTDA